MNVTLPDGTVLRDVPDGTTKADLRAKLARNGYDVSKLGGASEPAPDINEGMGAGEKFAVGMGASTARAGRGLYGLLPQALQKALPEALTPDEEGAKLYAKNKAGLGNWGTAGEIAGDVAVTAPLMGAGGAGTAMAAKALPKAWAALARGAGTLGTGAAVGAATAPEDRGTAAVLGGAGAGAGMAASRLIGGLAKPLVSDEAKALMQQGIQPTVGQSVGGTVNAIEQKLTSLPLAGDIIKNARNRAIGDFNKEGLRTVGYAGDDIGDKALIALRKKVGQKFDDAYATMPNTVYMDPQAIGARMQQLMADPAIGLSADGEAKLAHYVNKKILGYGADITPKTAQSIDTTLKNDIRNYAASKEPADRELGDALSHMQDTWHQSVGVYMTPEGQQLLKQAQQEWRAFLPLDRAGSSAGAQGAAIPGTLTPRQLRRSIEALDKSQNNNASRAAAAGQRTGNEYEQLNTLGRNAEILGDTVADSGTAGRWAHTNTPALLTGLAGAAPAGLAYTRVGQKMLTQGVAPEAAQKVVEYMAQRGISPEMWPQILPIVGASAARETRNAP